MYSTYKVQIICESDDKSKSKTVVVDKGAIPIVKTIEDVGFRHSKQIEILQGLQDEILEAQSPQFMDKNICSNCGNKMAKAGTGKSDFHTVFTDHKVTIIKQRCKCGRGSIPSIKSLFGTSTHPDLAKLHSELGAVNTYRKAQDILSKINTKVRKVNNHERIKRTVEQIGNYIGNNLLKESVKEVEPAEELILQVDGGHIKSVDKKKRSFEALASIVYKPENNIKDESGVGKIVNKTCVSSALESNDYIKRATNFACKKQGMSYNTVVVAICDGASNCWSVVDSIADKCKKVIKILDWFHIAKKIQNISLSEAQKKLLEKIKWCLWHGKVNGALERLDSLIDLVRLNKPNNKLIKFKQYIENNKDNIINYENYKKAGKVFTSQVIESTVGSLINQRCKKLQHMLWNREGVHPVLQIRSYMASNQWATNDNKMVLNAITQAA